MPETLPAKLLLLDGHAYAYRAFHAIKSLRSPAGSPTNAIYGFVSMLNKAVSFIQPTHAAVIWDGGLDEHRKELNPGYKAQRPEMPAELDEQIQQLQRFIPALGMQSLVQEGVEADDWIGSLALRMAGQGGKVVIASSDKDFMQLVSERIQLLNPNSKAEAMWGTAEVFTKAGVRPDQIVDWLSLMGDAVDNIDGVAGVGAKTAADLLGNFDSIDGIYSRITEVKPERIRGALVAAEKLVRRNQELVRLRTDCAAPENLDDLCITKSDVDSMAESYQLWGFRRLLEEVKSRRQSELVFTED